MPKTLIEKEHYRPAELARTLDLSLRTIYRWICEDRIAHVHQGGAVRIARDEFERVRKEGPLPSKCHRLS